MFSASIEGAFFGQRSKKAHQKKKALISNFFSANMLTEEPQRLDSGLWQFCFKEPKDSQSLVSKNNIKQIAKKETAYSRLFIELCTIFQALQEVDSLLQRRQLYFAEIRLIKQSVDRAPTGVPAIIIEEITDSIPDPPQEVEVMEQPQNHSKDVKDPESNTLE